MKSIVRSQPASIDDGSDLVEDPVKAINNGRSIRRKKVTFHDEITFDDGRAVIVCRQIAQGESRHVFVARDARSEDKTLYALKKINYDDDNIKDAVEQCRKEAAIHRKFHHENLMPLLGIKFDSHECYMLFPYIPCSLGDDITSRRLLCDTLESKRRPYSQKEALTMFSGIVSAVQTMHAAGISHRDLKVDNILLKNKSQGNIGIPVLMDFGSAGPLIAPLLSSSDVLLARQVADRHMTIPYRAPELGGDLACGPSKLLHYGCSDVWSLGCILFAMSYGASPFEIEWRVSLVEGAAAEGTALVVNCSYQKVLDGQVQFPPGGTAADRRYEEDMKDLIRWMLKKVWRERLCIDEVVARVGKLLKDKEGNGKS